MRPGQRKRRHRIVIEPGVQPRRGGVALRTSLRESQAYVVWIFRIIEVLLVTGDAIGGRPLETPAHVTRRAIYCGVRAGERKSCQLTVIETRTQPGIKAAVTLLAVC